MGIATVLGTEWQRRRSRLNHDWLKNEFLPAVGKMLNVLADRVEDPPFLEQFPRKVFAEWREHWLEAQCLVNEVTESLSPRTLMSASPWSELATSEREWLADLIHELWLARNDLHRKLAVANQAIVDVGIAFAEVQQAHWLGQDAKSLHTAWTMFYDQCWNLTRAIEQFPSEVGFT